MKWNKLSRIVEEIEKYQIGAKDWTASVAQQRQTGQGWINWDEETYEHFTETEYSVLIKILKAAGKGQKYVNWKVVPAARLKKIWGDFGKLTFVRDEKGMNSIADTVLYNIVALHVGNILSGHGMESIPEYIENVIGDDDLTEEQIKQIEDAVQLKDGTWIVSDFGLPYLYPLYHILLNANTSEEKLFTVDRILNVVHQRNDLAAFFVEGGIGTLMEVSEQ